MAEHLVQERVTEPPGGVLHVPSLLLSYARNVRARLMQVNPEAGAQLAHEPRVICRFLSQAVIEVSGHKREARAVQEVQSGDRIAATGHGHYQLGRTRREALRLGLYSD